METRCPHCSRVQSVPDEQLNKNVRCEECRGMFQARQFPKIEPVVKDTDGGLPEFTHWGPGWWLTLLALLGVVAAAGMTLGYGLAAAVPGLMFAGSAFVFALIINYLGYVSELLRHGLTNKHHRE